MAGLSDEEVNKIAAAIATRLEETHPEFWIEPEKHYLSHKELDAMVSDYRSVKGVFWKVFLAFVVLGSIILAALGLKGKL